MNKTRIENYSLLAIELAVGAKEFEKGAFIYCFLNLVLNLTVIFTI